MSEADNFGYAPNDVDSHDYCIDQMLKCKQMVCIVGIVYGGIYAGSKYKEYVKEIEKESKGKITQPSISLMEFYIGKRKGLTYRIFVQREILDEKKIYDENKDTYNGKVQPRVFDLVNFINHITKNGKRSGNWFMVFSSPERLEVQLKGIDFLK